MIDFDGFVDDVLDLNAFGRLVTYIPNGGQGKSVRIVFDNSFLSVQELGDASVASASPVAFCKTSDVESAARGDSMVIGDTTYYVTEVQPDGYGMTTLILSKDA